MLEKVTNSLFFRKVAGTVGKVAVGLAMPFMLSCSSGKVSCGNDQQCPGVSLCVNGECNNCGNDYDCDGDEVCENKVCVEGGKENDVGNDSSDASPVADTSIGIPEAEWTNGPFSYKMKKTSSKGEVSINNIPIHVTSAKGNNLENIAIHLIYDSKNFMAMAVDNKGDYLPDFIEGSSVQFNGKNDFLGIAKFVLSFLESSHKVVELSNPKKMKLMEDSGNMYKYCASLEQMKHDYIDIPAGIIELAPKVAGFETLHLKIVGTTSLKYIFEKYMENKYSGWEGFEIWTPKTAISFCDDGKVVCNVDDYLKLDKIFNSNKVTASETAPLWKIAKECTPQSSGCEPECNSGEIKCLDDAVAKCVYDADNCLVWKTKESCSGGKKCLKGECVCKSSDCVSDEIDCVDSESYKKCVEGLDGCFNFGTVASVGVGEYCEDDKIKKKNIECNKGDVKCKDDVSYLCQDGKWVSGKLVKGKQYCESGKVEDCKDPNEKKGKICEDKTSTAEWIEDKNGCLEKKVKKCLSDQECSNGKCYELPNILALQVSTGAGAACAIKLDNSLVCWGSGWSKKKTFDKYKAISTGGEHTCAIKMNDEVECWGKNTYGQSNNPSGKYKQLDTSWVVSCGVKQDDTISCWGDKFHAQTYTPSGKFSSIVVGFAHGCALENKKVKCWGNYVNKLTTPSGDFTIIDSSNKYTCGIKTDESVECWWSHTFKNEVGQVINPSGKFIALSVGSGHNCGIRKDDSVYCWGTEGAFKPLQGLKVKQISAGNGFTCAIMPDSEVKCVGSNYSGESKPPKK